MSDQFVGVHHFWRTEAFNSSFSAFSDGRFTNLYIHYGTSPLAMLSGGTNIGLSFPLLLPIGVYRSICNSPRLLRHAGLNTARITFYVTPLNCPEWYKNGTKVVQSGTKNHVSRPYTAKIASPGTCFRLVTFRLVTDKNCDELQVLRSKT